MDKTENTSKNNILTNKFVASLVLIPLGWIIVASGVWLFFDLIRKILSLFGILGHVLIFLCIFFILTLWHFFTIKWIRTLSSKKEDISS